MPTFLHTSPWIKKKNPKPTQNKKPPHPKTNQLPLQKSCQNLWNASICENIVFQEYKILCCKSTRRDADCVSWISFFFTSNSVCRKSFCLCVEYRIISVKNNQKNPRKNQNQHLSSHIWIRILHSLLHA